MSEYTRLAGIEPLYKYDLDPKIDKSKAREAAHIEMARLRKEKEHQSVLDDHQKVMSGLKKTDQAGILDVDDGPEPAQDENLDMGQQGDPDAEPFAGLESRRGKPTKAQSVAAKRAFVKQAQAKRWQKMPGIDSEEYPPIKGMEGPFGMKVKGQRHILYYDPKEGQYYDRKKDMYVQVESVQQESSLVSGILASSPGKYVLSRENGKYHLEKKSGGRRTHKAVNAKSAYELFKMAKKKEVAPEDAFPAHVIESIQESVTPGDIWVQNFKTQKSIYFFPLRKGKNGNFQGLMYDPNFSRKAKMDSVWKINAPKSSRSLWKVETRVPLAAKEAFMDHPKYQQALEALEGIQRIAKFNEGDAGRYEIVVKGKLYNTSKKPSVAIVIGKRQKGSVQVVDSKTGKIIYDSEMKGKPDAKRAKKISAIQRLRLNRADTDAKLRKAKG